MLIWLLGANINVFLAIEQIALAHLKQLGWNIIIPIGEMIKGVRDLSMLVSDITNHDYTNFHLFSLLTIN